MEEWLGNGGDSQGYRNGELVQRVSEMWSGGGFQPGETSAPTGEYIIRDGYYHNGVYILVGSYRGYFSRLKATGAEGYAWDGFVLYHRGYNVVTGQSGASGFIEPMDYCIFPMLWPTICDTPNVALLDDATVGTGLYAVTPLKTVEDLQPGTGSVRQINLDIVVGGYHVAPTTNITDAETVGAACQITNAWSGGNSDGKVQYIWKNTESFYLGYDYDLTMLRPDQTMLFRDWRDVIAMGDTALLGATPYERILWEQGCKPDGTNPLGGPTSTDNGIENNGYLPLKILGVRSVSGVTYGAGDANIEGVVYMCGQMATSDPAKEIETKCPFYMALDMSYKSLDGIYLGAPPLNYLGPWTVAVVAYTSTSIPGITSPYDSGLGLYTTGFQCADTTGGAIPSKNIQALYGAAALDIMPPAELVGAFAGGNVSPMMVTIGGTQYPEYPTADVRAALYTAQGFPIFGDQSLPIGVAGGSMEDIADIYLPSKGFACSLQQFRTYTFSEENASMDVQVGRGDERESTAGSVWDRDTDQFVGWKGNYPRYATSKQGGQIAGKQTFIGYAAVGWYDPTDGNIPVDRHGPCLLSYDSGDPAIVGYDITTGGPPPAPVTQGKVEFTIRTREDGSKLNAAIGVGGGGTPSLRRCDWAGWDNDRDQWLFVVAGDGEGVSIISVDAPFTTFLDQTAAFGDAGQNTKWGTAKYFPLSMSDALDGLVVFGERSQDDLGNVAMFPIYGAEYDAIIPWGVGTYKAKTTVEMKAYRIDGSTGRTARVWIDYMLYDGVDAVIAMQLRDWGMRVTVENVEWFKARVLQEGDIKAKGEEIEEWMEQQGKEYQDMMKQKERGGRLRKRRSQISAYKREVGDLMTPDQIDTQVYDFVPKGIAAQQRLKTSEGALKEVPPDSIEAMVERDYRAGFDTTPSGVIEPGDQLPEDPAKPAGTFMDTGDAPKKAPDEGGDPDEEYISEN
jgi:hypothetical protein